MGLNVSKGNMYEFITHTWNTVKGECPHGCTYCYMGRWGKQKPVRFDEKEFKEFDDDMKKFGDDQFIFVGSSCDMFADEIPLGWILRTLQHCSTYNNEYFFQTKSVHRLYDIEFYLPVGTSICTTIESNRHYKEIMKNSPIPAERAQEMSYMNFNKYVTIEPILDFDVIALVNLIEMCEATQVNIGADSGNNNLPEPSPEKIRKLIIELSKFTKVHQKKNLKRLLN